MPHQLPCDRSPPWRRAAPWRTKCRSRPINRPQPAGYRPQWVALPCDRSRRPRTAVPQRLPCDLSRRPRPPQMYSLNMCSNMIYTDNGLSRSRRGAQGGTRMPLHHQRAAQSIPAHVAPRTPVFGEWLQMVANGCAMVAASACHLLASCLPPACKMLARNMS